MERRGTFFEASMALGKVGGMRRVGLWASIVVIALLASGCGGQDDPPEPPGAYVPTPHELVQPDTTTTTTSALRAAILSRTPGTEEFNPVVSRLLMSVRSEGRTSEQLVADELAEYSSTSVTANDVRDYIDIGCVGPSGDAANSLTSLVDRATPAAAVAMKHAVDLLVINCSWSNDDDGVNEQDQQYLNSVSNYVAGFVLTRPLPAVSTTTTLPPPSASNNSELYKAVCTAGSAAVAASTWAARLKSGRGGWLGLAIVAGGFSYCPTAVRSAFG